MCIVIAYRLLTNFIYYKRTNSTNATLYWNIICAWFWQLIIFWKKTTGKCLLVLILQYAISCVAISFICDDFLIETLLALSFLWINIVWTWGYLRKSKYQKLVNATCYSVYTSYLAVIGKMITPSTTCITCPRSAPDSSPVHV